MAARPAAQRIVPDNDSGLQRELVENVKQISARLRRHLLQPGMTESEYQRVDPGRKLAHNWLERKYASGIRWAADNPEDAEDLVVTFLASGPVDSIGRIWLDKDSRRESVDAARQTDAKLRRWVVQSPSVKKKELSPALLKDLRQALKAAYKDRILHGPWLGPGFKDPAHARAFLAKQRQAGIVQYGQSPVQIAMGSVRAAMEAQRRAIGHLIESGEWADQIRARIRPGKWKIQFVGRKKKPSKAGKHVSRKAGRVSDYVRAGRPSRGRRGPVSPTGSLGPWIPVDKRAVATPVRLWAGTRR